MQDLLTNPETRALLTALWAAMITAALNFLLRTRTPEEWEELKMRSPRLAGLITLIRGLGVDTHKIIRGLIAIFGGKK